MRGKWVLKALVQKGISLLPYSHRINYLFQRYVTRGVVLNENYFFDRIIHGRNHLEAYRKLTGSKSPNKTLELGSGWYPIVPIYLYLTGSNEIWSIDILDYSSIEGINKTIEMFINQIDAGLLYPETEGFIEQRIDNLRQKLDRGSATKIDALLELNIKQIIANAATTEFSSNYFDLIHSNNTFEHIPEAVLVNILKEFMRILKDHGAMSHFIDLSDHFAHFDHSISIYNFLRFSDFQWRIIDNSIQPQNRLRIADYHRILRKTDVNYEVFDFREGDFNALKSVRLHQRYAEYSMNDLAVSHCHFIATKG